MPVIIIIIIINDCMQLFQFLAFNNSECKLDTLNVAISFKIHGRHELTFIKRHAYNSNAFVFNISLKKDK